MFCIARGVSLDELANRLARELERELRGRDLFFRAEVVVPNQAVGNYLKQRLAVCNGIVSGIDFVYLMDFVKRDLMHASGSKNGVDSDTGTPGQWQANLRQSTIAWRIFPELPAVIRQYPAFEQWAERPEHDPAALWQLAARLGELYEGYIRDFPRWVAAWETGARQPVGETVFPAGREPEALRMLAGLWHRISATWGERSFAAWFAAVEAGETALPRVFPAGGSLHLFGLATLGEPMLRLLELLAQSGTPVRLYNLEPCRCYWGDVRTPKQEARAHLHLLEQSPASPELLASYFYQFNELVGSFARQRRELYWRTMDLPELPEISGVPAENPSHLLGAVQQLIHENSPDKLTGYAGKCDHSIQLHGCYNPMREVEALYDFLLNRLAADDTLREGDILVLTPDVRTYAPLIRAVFEAPGSPLRISIADLRPGDEVRSYQTLLRLLSAGTGDLTLSEVDLLLGDAGIREKLGFSAEEAAWCCRMAAKAGVRWGYDAGEHAGRTGTAFPETSWRAGLDRLLLGYAIDFAPLQECGGVFPVAGAGTGGRQAEVLGLFVSWIEMLQQVRRDNTPAPWSEWRRRIESAARHFFVPEHPVHVFLGRMLQQISADVAAAGSWQVPLDAAVAARVLADKDGSHGGSGSLLRGRINFCSLRPLRGIPARVVCLIGMNYDAFPAVRPQLSYDLRTMLRRADKKTGRQDVTPRDEDRQLFLDLFLAAGDVFYVSYIAFDPRENKSLPPSSCVSELTGYLRRAGGDRDLPDRSEWEQKYCYFCRREPLQAFLPDNFLPGEPTRSHSAALLACAGMLQRNERVPRPDDWHLPENSTVDWQTLTEEDWIAFFRNPTRYYLRKRLKAGVSVKPEEIPDDDEPLEPTLSWLFKNQMMEQMWEGAAADDDTWLRWARAQAELAPSGCGDAVFMDFIEQLRDLLDNRDNCCRRGTVFTLPAKDFTDGVVTLKLPERRLLRTADGRLFQLIPAPDDKVKRRLPAILQHVGANLLAPVSTVLMLVTDKRKNCLLAPPMEQTAAGQAAKELLSLYTGGMSQPLLFFPKTSEAVWQGKSPEQQWNNYMTPEWGDYVPCFDENMPDPDLLTAIADTVFEPVKWTKVAAGEVFG